MLFLLRGFSVQSTNMDRTIESLRCVIAGMFGVYTFSQSGTIYVTHFNIIYNIISHAPLGGCLCFTHSPSIVPMCRLTGGLPLQWLAHSSGLAVLACVRCQGGPLSSVPLIRTTHYSIIIQTTCTVSAVKLHLRCQQSVAGLEKIVI